MSDIRIASTFRFDEKRLNLEAIIGPQGVLGLLDLWLEACEYRPDGLLVGYTTEDIETVALWGGPAGDFVAALKSVGYLAVTDSGNFELLKWQGPNPSEVRSRVTADKARMSMLSYRHRDLFEKLKAAGVTRLSPEEYDELTIGLLPRGGKHIKTAGENDADGILRVGVVSTRLKKTRANLSKDKKRARGGGLKRPKKGFVQPTREEVAAYIKEKNYDVDPDHFYDYYESNGWKVGRNKMQKWKFAVSNWNRNKWVGGRQKKQPSFNDLLEEAFGELKEGRDER